MHHCVVTWYHMPDVAVVGGGPAGLSAALFTAKNDLDTVVFDTDGTAMHAAWLYNYLGIESIDGDEFMEIARRQVDDYGVDRRQGEEVTGERECRHALRHGMEDEEDTVSWCGAMDSIPFWSFGGCLRTARALGAERNCK